MATETGSDPDGWLDRDPVPPTPLPAAWAGERLFQQAEYLARRVVERSVPCPIALPVSTRWLTTPKQLMEAARHIETGHVFMDGTVADPCMQRYPDGDVVARLNPAALIVIAGLPVAPKGGHAKLVLHDKCPSVRDKARYILGGVASLSLHERNMIIGDFSEPLMSMVRAAIDDPEEDIMHIGNVASCASKTVTAETVVDVFGRMRSQCRMVASGDAVDILGSDTPRHETRGLPKHDRVAFVAGVWADSVLVRSPSGSMAAEDMGEWLNLVYGLGDRLVARDGARTERQVAGLSDMSQGGPHTGR